MTPNFELNGGEEKAERIVTCPRCRDVNFPETLYCRRCGLPLNDKAKMLLEVRVGEGALTLGSSWKNLSSAGARSTSA